MNAKTYTCRVDATKFHHQECACDDARERDIAILRSQLSEARNSRDQLAVQLAGCLTAAEGLIEFPAKQGEYGWSLAYQKTLELRQERDTAIAEARRMLGLAHLWMRYLE